jgi:hypothetical protein
MKGGFIMKKPAKKGKTVKPKIKKEAKSKAAGKPTKDGVALLKQQMAKLKRESNAKGKEAEAAKKLLAQKETELNRLEETVEYKNRQMASKEVEIESYKRITEEKMFQLEAKVKELEGKVGGPSFIS